jgi:excisionase family DNA binding protein
MDADKRRHAIVEPIALTILQAAELSGLCRSVIYEEIHSGRLRALKRGRSTRILMNDLRKYMATLPAIQSQTAAPVANAKPGRQRTKRRRAA